VTSVCVGASELEVPAGEVVTRVLRALAQAVAEALSRHLGADDVKARSELEFELRRLGDWVWMFGAHFEETELERFERALRELLEFLKPGGAAAEPRSVAELQSALAQCVSELSARATDASQPRRGVSCIPFAYACWSVLSLGISRLAAERDPRQAERAAERDAAERGESSTLIEVEPEVEPEVERMVGLLAVLDGAVASAPRALLALRHLQQRLGGAGPARAGGVARPELAHVLDLLGSVADALFQPKDETPMEIERRFVLDALPELPPDHQVLELEQGWLSGRGTVRERLRRTRRDGVDRYVRTVKLGSGVSRFEWEEEISEQVFERLWPGTEGCRIRKTRYRVPCPVPRPNSEANSGVNTEAASEATAELIPEAISEAVPDAIPEAVPGGVLQWEIDHYPELGFHAAEIELPTADARVEIPAWLAPHVRAEVTEDPRFTSLQLALRGAPPELASPKQPQSPFAEDRVSSSSDS